MWRHPLFITGLGIGAVGAAILANVVTQAPEDEAGPADPPVIAEPAAPPPVSEVPPEPKTAAAPEQTASDEQPAQPVPAPEPAAPPGDPLGFDVVRVNPEGDTVVAGRALPGSKVRIMDGDTQLGEVTADNRGEWVFVPDTPLPPGTRELSLEMETADGTSTKSSTAVVLDIPGPNAPAPGEQKTASAETSPAAKRPLAVQVPRSGEGASEVLQRPGASSGPGDLEVGAVDYAPGGEVTISGRAPADARVRLYLDRRFLGEAKSDADGQWSLAPEADIPPGKYTLRADQLSGAGKVAARISLPFAQVDKLPDVPKDQLIVVQPGNSLWRIARRIYGDGVHFATIFQANAGRIEDPDLIYPGQVFTLPQSVN